MSKVIIVADVLRGKKQVDVFDMVPSMGFTTGINKVDNLVKPSYLSGANIMAPPIMNRAIQNPAIFKSVGCKNEPTSQIIVRRRALPNYIGTYPQTGIFRHEKKGLVFEKSNNLKLMPLPSSFFGGGNSMIPQPS